MRVNFFTVFRRLLIQKEEYSPEIGYTRDISSKNIYFFTRSKIEQGEDIFVSIHTASDWAEGGNPPRLEGTGKIVRVERALDEFPLSEFKGVAVAFDEDLTVSV